MQRQSTNILSVLYFLLLMPDSPIVRLVLELLAHIVLEVHLQFLLQRGSMDFQSFGGTIAF